MFRDGTTKGTKGTKGTKRGSRKVDEVIAMATSNLSKKRNSLELLWRDL
jgi:hypothetical protein